MTGLWSQLFASKLALGYKHTLYAHTEKNIYIELKDPKENSSTLEDQLVAVKAFGLDFFRPTRAKPSSNPNLCELPNGNAWTIPLLNAYKETYISAN